MQEFLDKVKLHFKDVYASPSHEHIRRAIRMIRKSGIDKSYKGSILDIGAYNGEVSLLFRKYFPDCTIHAFEPNPTAIELFKANVKEQNIVLHPLALSDRNGSETLHVTANLVSSSLNDVQVNPNEMSSDFASQLAVGKKITIPVHTLDEMNLGSPLIVKMDTQANETKVIAGGKETLKRTSVIITEMHIHSIYKQGCSYFETDKELRELGFILADVIIPARRMGVWATEFDAIYYHPENMKTRGN